ncbi:uncharacterized protein LOC112893705 isoform X1 [Panicum hallii]|uniref:uncharacterized protein LOC112893705 isoform X1 n=1 Tax=Panicum hallii TaxID=206008 RepID=UPI000DF4D88E|nr:uncharacterized protein LOC112893705 isoform X1 [Panicum hallii]
MKLVHVPQFCDLVSWALPDNKLLQFLEADQTSNFRNYVHCQTAQALLFPPCLPPCRIQLNYLQGNSTAAALRFLRKKEVGELTLAFVGSFIFLCLCLCLRRICQLLCLCIVKEGLQLRESAREGI